DRIGGEAVHGRIHTAGAVRAACVEEGSIWLHAPSDTTSVRGTDETGWAETTLRTTVLRAAENDLDQAADRSHERERCQPRKSTHNFILPFDGGVGRVHARSGFVVPGRHPDALKGGRSAAEFARAETMTDGAKETRRTGQVRCVPIAKHRT